MQSLGMGHAMSLLYIKKDLVSILKNGVTWNSLPAKYNTEPPCNRKFDDGKNFRNAILR